MGSGLDLVIESHVAVILLRGDCSIPEARKSKALDQAASPVNKRDRFKIYMRIKEIVLSLCKVYL
jgi:hypothetical protein